MKAEGKVRIGQLRAEATKRMDAALAGIIEGI
jgi:hypothetical protein